MPFRGTISLTIVPTQSCIRLISAYLSPTIRINTVSPITRDLVTATQGMNPQKDEINERQKAEAIPSQSKPTPHVAN